MTRRTPVFLLVSIACGLLIGAITLLATGALPSDLLQLSNSGAVWVVVAFVLGRLARSRQIAAIAGVLAVLAELVGYYVAAHYIIDADTSVAIFIFWLLIALVAGPLLGLAGYFSRNAQGWTKKLGAAALGAAFIGEGLFFLTVLSYRQTAILWFVIGAAITLLVAWKSQARAQALLITAGLGLLFYAGELLMVLADTVRAQNF